MQGDPTSGLGLETAWQLLLAWLTLHEVLLIFLAILFEESGIPMPIPADIAMAMVGYRVAQGRMTLLEAFIIGQSATLIGSSILYWVGRRGGRPLLYRYGKLIHLSPQRISQVERLVTQHGPLSVIIGRQIPGLRLAAPLACGIFRVRYRLFLPAMFVGSSVYIGIFIALGMWGGPALFTRLRVQGVPFRLLGSTILLVVAALLLRVLSRRAREVVGWADRRAASHRRSLEAALLAGLVASALTSLGITWLLDLISFVAHTAPERALLQWLDVTATVAVPGAGPQNPYRLLMIGLLATLPAQAVSHILWACLYALMVQPYLRGRSTIRGLQFALLPWLFSGLVVFPLLDAGFFGTLLNAGPLPMIGELFRSILFGATLGTLYRLIRLARQPRQQRGAHCDNEHDQRNQRDQPTLPPHANGMNGIAGLSNVGLLQNGEAVPVPDAAPDAGAASIPVEAGAAAVAAPAAETVAIPIPRTPSSPVK